MTQTAETREAPHAGETAPPSQTATARWFSSTFECFRLPVYRVIWLGTIMSFTAFNISMTAQNVVAYDLTGNNRAVGFVAFGQGLAMLFLNPFGGAIADRFSKRMLILFAQTVIGSVALAIAILIATGHISIFFLALGAFTVGSMFSFLGPTRMALLGDFVPANRMGNAMALIQVGGNFARISGPLIAGALLAWSLIGASGTYFFIASIFIFVIATLYQIPSRPPRVDRRDTSVLQDVRIGFRHVLGNPRLLHSVLSFHLVTILGMSYFVLMPGFAKDVLHAGTTGLGAMLGVTAAGGLLASIFVASLADSPKAPLLLTASSFGLGASIFVLGFAPGFVLALFVMVFVGATSSAFQTLNNAVTLRRTENAYIGRVVAILFLAWGLNALCGLPVGYLADLIGERVVLSGLGGSLCVVVVLLAVWERTLLGREAVPAKVGS